MEIFIIIAIATAVLVGRWLLTKGFDTAWSAGNRAVHKREHAEGQRLVKQVVSVTAPPMRARRVIDAIDAELNVFEEAPMLGHRAYATRVDAGTLRVDFGNKLFTGWTVAIVTTGDPSEGVTVTAKVVDGTEVDGVMPGSRELGLVFDRVKSAVEKLARNHEVGDTA